MLLISGGSSADRHRAVIRQPIPQRRSKSRPRISRARLDCHERSEQITGWLTMIEENLSVPFDATVLRVAVTVERVDLDRSQQIVAVCTRARNRQSLHILELPLPTPPQDGVEWIEAYRRWLGEGS